MSGGDPFREPLGHGQPPGEPLDLPGARLLVVGRLADPGREGPLLVALGLVGHLLVVLLLAGCPLVGLPGVVVLVAPVWPVVVLLVGQSPEVVFRLLQLLLLALQLAEVQLLVQDLHLQPGQLHLLVEQGQFQLDLVDVLGKLLGLLLLRTCPVQQSGWAGHLCGQPWWHSSCSVCDLVEFVMDRCPNVLELLVLDLRPKVLTLL